MLLLLAGVTAALWLFGGLEVALGSRRIGYLRDVRAGPSPESIPRVCVVVAARNEAASVGECVGSLLGQRGIEIGVIAADDRSEDATGEVLDRLAAGDDRLRVVRIEVLPPGWLGKNHALHHAAALATQEWLLFTDADVHFEPRAVARAVDYATFHRLDHLAITPELNMPTLTTNVFAGVFVVLFARYATPWKARNPQSRSHVGIGAFNLLRTACYRELGGHSRIRLRPDDDMMLGRMVKEAGLRQDMLYGTGELSVRWYGSVREAIRGLEKNAFAGMHYSLVAVVAACLCMLLFGAWPWVAILFTDGLAQGLNAAAVVAMAGLYVQSTRSSGASPWLAPAIPVAFCILSWAVIRSAALALLRGEIRWRGTAYPLDELRRQRL